MNKQTNFAEIFEQPYKLPQEHIGEKLTPNGLTKNQPRRWTTQEESHALLLREKGLTNHQIAFCLERDVVQVGIKIKRLLKKTGEYNDRHQQDKYQTNDLFLALLQPSTVLDLFAGPDSYYHDKVEEVYTNDVNPDYGTYYNERAEVLAATLANEGQTFDLVDVDPFGAAFDCLESALQLADRGLVVTFGELGHRRWKRLDYVGPRYGIAKVEEFTAEYLAKFVQGAGEKYGKKLDLIFLRKWHNIARAYYIINPQNQVKQ